MIETKFNRRAGALRQFCVHHLATDRGCSAGSAVPLGSGHLRQTLRIGILLLIGCVTLLVSCGKVPDPSFVRQTGDLGSFLVKVISTDAPRLTPTNPTPNIQTAWHFRVLSHRHKSGEYLNGSQALQIATDSTNFTRLESLLTQVLGSPTLPLRQEDGGWRHVGWNRRDSGLGVWLVEDGKQCRIEVVTEESKEK
jgi:hypothetical protein